MKEHEKPEVQLAIRSDGLDLHLNGPDVERRNRVLRALELGGPPGIVAVDPGFSPPAVAVVPRQPAPQQDDEALVAHNLATHLRTTKDLNEISWDELARAALAHLRAQGLMRTPGDVSADRWLSATEEIEALKDALAGQMDEATKYQSQVRALTAKAEEANARAEKAEATWRNMRDFESLWRQAERDRNTAVDNLDSAQKSLEASNGSYARLHAEHARLKTDLATTEQAYQREQEARKRAEAANTELEPLSHDLQTAREERERIAANLFAAEQTKLKAELARQQAQQERQAAEKRAHDAGQEVAWRTTEMIKAQKLIAELEAQVYSAPKWSGGRPVTQEEWDRYVALAAEVPQLKVLLGEP